jgi:hypothetical protein
MLLSMKSYYFFSINPVTIKCYLEFVVEDITERLISFNIFSNSSKFASESIRFVRKVGIDAGSSMTGDDILGNLDVVLLRKRSVENG